MHSQIADAIQSSDAPFLGIKNPEEYEGAPMNVWNASKVL